MRIAWFHSHLLNADSGGTRFVFDTIELMKREHGHEVALFCDVVSKTSLERAADIGVPIVTLDTISTNSPLYWITLPGRVRRKQKRVGIAAATFDVAVTSMFPMNWVIENLDIPKVQVCYEPFAFFYDRAFTSTLRRAERLFFALASRRYAGRDKRAVRRMTRVVTINATNRARIRAVYGVEPAVVYAGVDTALFHRASTEGVSSALRAFDRRPLLFHSTDLSGTKGTVAFLDVFKNVLAEFPRAMLLITVYVENAVALKNLHLAIRRLGIESAVEVLGCLPRAALPSFYSAVDFVCQPSLGQPASWPLRESLMCGTPIVGGLQSEEVEDGVNGYRIDVTDVGASAARLISAIRSRDSLDATTSGNAIREKFSRERCAADFDRIVREAMQRVPTAANP